MTGKPISHWQKLVRHVLALVVAIAVLVPQAAVPVAADSGGDRTLYLYHTHTKQTGRFTFKRNGQYDQKVLRDMNIFLADWRTKDPTKMDPALFDLIWTIYQEVGATNPVNIVSSYRSPKTNAMLRKTSSGVAENSQHMRGKAMDIFIPGVPLDKLRATAMRHQVGGVGYYPTSGSPFVHVDTGSVRAWPRMTRAQLKKVFPDGKTLHLPTDGKPLSSSARAYAEAQWNKCHTVPCNGTIVTAPDLSGSDVMIATAEPGETPFPLYRPKSLLGSAPEVQLASLGQDPAERTVPVIEITAPQPATRSASLFQAASLGSQDGMVVPATKSPTLMLATRDGLPADADGPRTALAALDTAVPQPRVLMTRRAGDPLVTAYGPANDRSASAERALQLIIERESVGVAKASLGQKPGTARRDEIRTASLGGASLKGMFDKTFSAVNQQNSPAIAAALQKLVATRKPLASLAEADRDLLAPEIDRVDESMVAPVPLTDEHFAAFDGVEGYLDKSTELGSLSGRVGFTPDDGHPIAAYDHFVIGAPLLVASR